MTKQTENGEQLSLERQIITEFLHSEQWQLVKKRLQRHLDHSVDALACGTSLDIEGVRHRQGRISVLRQLILTPEQLLKDERG